MHNAPKKPWYREPWPWILMAGPAAVVVAGTVTAAIAFSTADTIVTDRTQAPARSAMSAP